MERKVGKNSKALDIEKAAADGQKSFENFLLTGRVGQQERVLPLKWNIVPESLPPRVNQDWSDRIWVALSNGKVAIGKCLHHEEGAVAKTPVHSWFTDDSYIDPDEDDFYVVAWMPFAVPDHPQLKLGKE